MIRRLNRGCERSGPPRAPSAPALALPGLIQLTREAHESSRVSRLVDPQIANQLKVPPVRSALHAPRAAVATTEDRMLPINRQRKVKLLQAGFILVEFLSADWSAKDFETVWRRLWDGA